MLAVVADFIRLADEQIVKLEGLKENVDTQNIVITAVNFVVTKLTESLWLHVEAAEAGCMVLRKVVEMEVKRSTASVGPQTTSAVTAAGGISLLLTLLHQHPKSLTVVQCSFDILEQLAPSHHIDEVGSYNAVIDALKAHQPVAGAKEDKKSAAKASVYQPLLEVSLAALSEAFPPSSYVQHLQLLRSAVL